jgi:hypothetical protein
MLMMQQIHANADSVQTLDAEKKSFHLSTEASVSNQLSWFFLLYIQLLTALNFRSPCLS